MSNCYWLSNTNTAHIDFFFKENESRKLVRRRQWYQVEDAWKFYLYGRGMTSFFSSVLACWTNTFASGWLEDEHIQSTPSNLIAVDSQKEQKAGSTAPSLSTPVPLIDESVEAQNTPLEVEDYESTVEWECWDDEEEEQEQDPKPIEIPIVSVPSVAIKATIVQDNSYLNMFGTPKDKSEEEEEEDFFADMVPTIKPAITYIREEKKPEISSRIQMDDTGLDLEETDFGEGWGDDDIL